MGADQEVEIRADDRTGRVKLIVEEFNGRKRNKVAAWLLPKPANAPLSNARIPNTNPPANTDDNIPF